MFVRSKGISDKNKHYQIHCIYPNAKFSFNHKILLQLFILSVQFI